MLLQQGVLLIAVEVGGVGGGCERPGLMYD